MYKRQINTIAGIYQEIKAKITLDRLKIIVSSKVDVIRNGITKTIAINEIVLDDYLILHTGMQIPSDSILVDGYVEANEALLTGESDPISVSYTHLAKQIVVQLSS